MLSLDEATKKAMQVAAQEIVVDLATLEATIKSGQFEISSEQEFIVSGEVLKLLKARIDQVEEKRKSFADPFYALWKTVNKEFKPYTDRYEKIVDAVKLGVVRYQARLAEQKRLALAEAAKLAEQGQSSGTGTDVKQYQALMAHGSAAAPKVEGVSLRKTVKWRIVDASAVPAQYTTTYVDPKKVEPVVKAQGLGTQIPGIEVYEEQSVAVRA